MPASTEALVFGPEADPSTQVVLPHFIESGEPLERLGISISF